MFLHRKWSLIVCLLGVVFAHAAGAGTQTVTNLLGSNPAASTKVERVIRAHFPDAPIMVEVARCESELRHRTPKGDLLPNQEGGTARGVFQVLMRIHEPEMRRMNLDPNDDEDYLTYVRHLFDTYGLKPWRPSRHCWGEHLA